jgi:DNA transposition AAA+ family ATPase
MNDTRDTQELAAHPLHAGAGGNGDNIRASWRWSLDQVNEATKHCGEDGRAALRGAFLFCTDAAHPFHFHEFCRRVGYDSTSVDQMFRGRYKPTKPGAPGQDVPVKFIRAVQAFTTIEGDRALGGRTGFVETPTAKRVWKACDLARESQTPVFLIGPSHCGKTWALEQYARDNNHGSTVYCRMEAAGGLGGMVRAIAQALRISPKQNAANLKKAIRNAITPDMLVILDEMHLLHYTYREQSFFACVEVIREFYDRAKNGWVLCGTDLMADKMESGKDRELKQIMRRGVHRFVFGNPTSHDVEAILADAGLDLPDAKATITVGSHTEQPRALLKQLANQHGLKSITERLRYARRLAAKAGQRLCWAQFIRADQLIRASSIPPDAGW